MGNKSRRVKESPKTVVFSSECGEAGCESCTHFGTCQTMFHMKNICGSYKYDEFSACKGCIYFTSDGEEPCSHDPETWDAKTCYTPPDYIITSLDLQ